MKNRAITPEQKKQLLNDLLELWLQVPDLRLGQFFANSIEINSEPGEDICTADLFYIEDEALLVLCDKFIKHSKE